MEDINELSYDDLEEMENLQEDQQEDSQENNLLGNMTWQDAYGVPEPEEKVNQHTFLSKAAFETDDTVRVSYLSEPELGRPLFSVRFLWDLANVAKHYLSPVIKDIGLDPNRDNRIANYFWQKVQSITTSGMSKDGFTMGLNVMKKIDVSKKRIKNLNLDKNNMKGG